MFVSVFCVFCVICNAILWLAGRLREEAQWDGKGEAFRELEIGGRDSGDVHDREGTVGIPTPPHSIHSIWCGHYVL